jgi:hypothetical protein
MEQRWLGHYLTAQAWGLLAGCLVAGTGPIGINLYQCAGLQPIAVLLLAGSFLGMLLPGLFARVPRSEAAGGAPAFVTSQAA